MHPGASARTRRAALYAGAFLGPFGGGVLVVLIPDLRHVFGVSIGEASAVIPAYVIPFALLQLVSGTLGERFGMGRTIRAAYVAYAVASLLAALATSFELLLVARALQGAANAFTMPLLLTALAADVPPERLGRSMGVFASLQTAGLVSAPLLGGLAGHVDLRLAFIGPAIAALVLALVPLPTGGRDLHATPPRLRAALNPRVQWLAVAAFLSYLALVGLAFLVALYAADELGLSATERGLVLSGFGLAGIVVSPFAGLLVDRFGPARVAMAGALAGAATVPFLGLVATPVLLTFIWVVAGLGSALLWTALNMLMVQASPANRGGAVSYISAWKFAGNAAGPAVWLPLYTEHAWTAFAAAGLVCAGIALIVRRASTARTS